MSSQLEAALQNCSLHALLILTSRALARQGYGDVRFLDRRYSRQKSRYGGHELICEATLGTRLVTVIVKVVRDSARIRNLDELAGTVIRSGADAGLLLTPFHVTNKAQTHLDRYGPVRINVIDGSQLSGWMADLKLGVRSNGEVDYAFFGELEAIAERIDVTISAISQ